MTNEQLEVKAAFDAIAGRLDQGIVEFENRDQMTVINDLRPKPLA